MPAPKTLLAAVAALALIVVLVVQLQRSKAPPEPPSRDPVAQAQLPASSAKAQGPTGEAIRWAPPSGWFTVANPTAMRIASYSVPAAPGDFEGGDAFVARAGGTPDANIERWIGQFEDPGPGRRSDITVHDIRVHVVEITGTYLSGAMMPGAPSKPKPNWGLLGAVIEGPGDPYFFKLTGPKNTVAHARSTFDEWVASVTLSP